MSADQRRALIKPVIEAQQDQREWAYRLRNREINGTGLTKFQRDAWREALGMPLTAPARTKTGEQA